MVCVVQNRDGEVVGVFAHITDALSKAESLAKVSESGAGVSCFRLSERGQLEPYPMAQAYSVEYDPATHRTVTHYHPPAAGDDPKPRPEVTRTQGGGVTAGLFLRDPEQTKE